MPLEILGRDMCHVSVMHTGQVQVETTCEETGEKTVKTRDVNAAYYLNPFHDECITAEEMFWNHFSMTSNTFHSSPMALSMRMTLMSFQMGFK
jgi:hypothetical protein